MSKAPFIIENENGKSQFIFLCDHASNFIPDEYDNLGLSEKERLDHITWDPGSLKVSQILSKKLDAPIIHSTISRLVIDVNRRHDAKDLMPQISENTKILDNENIDENERERRIKIYHTPYHDAISTLLDKRQKAGAEIILIAMHSFTPIYNGVSRPWEIGFIPCQDEDFTKQLFLNIKENNPKMNVGWNKPYAAKQGVFYTMHLHADKRKIKGSMVEIRNDEIADEAGVKKWAKIMEKSLIASLN